ncbi:hypothetical protein [Arcobacter sp. LA11]|uniref:hypothetical protein n=1 Tax=Arcobacter sp. LA11 TaxID=1898176 RepID=UPI000933DC8A|nr:hypothetical protein [Arcobacter sp. LA11]
MKKIKFIFLLQLLLINISVYAATGTATGKVKRIYIYNNGQVLVAGFNFPEANCQNNSGFYIPGDHPHLEKYMSLLLSSKAMNLTVTVVAKTDNCWYPQINESGELTYLYIE